MDVGFAIADPRWRDRATKALLVASHASSVVSRQALVPFRLLGLTKDLWSLDRQLREFLEGIYSETVPGRERQAPPPTDDQVRAGVESLRQLYTRM